MPDVTATPIQGTMKQSKFLGVLFTLLTFSLSAQKFSRVLLKADQAYICHEYGNAAAGYENYLKSHPRDYYASRQAAICYERMNDPGMAIDHWPAVAENGEASDQDRLAYSKSLLANYRREDAARQLLLLAHSSDPAVAAWAAAYRNPSLFFNDSALTSVTDLRKVNTPKQEYAPVFFNGRLFSLSDASKRQHNFNSFVASKWVEARVAEVQDTITSSDNRFPEISALKPGDQFCFSPDGTTIWFSRVLSSKEMELKVKPVFYHSQLYFVSRSNPKEVHYFKHNNGHYDYMHPSLSHDGQHLYFASNTKGSLGGMDVFVCDLVNGEWSEPRNLGPSVNSVGNEVYPHITEEGLLYFSSDHLPGLGGLDIFFAKPESGSGFQKAVNAGAWLNSQFDDFGVFLLPGGKTGYLTSNRKNVTDDNLYFFRDEREK